MGGRLKDLWEPSWETVAADCQEPGMRLGAGAGAGHGPRHYRLSPTQYTPAGFSAGSWTWRRHLESLRDRCGVIEKAWIWGSDGRESQPDHFLAVWPSASYLSSLSCFLLCGIRLSPEVTDSGDKDLGRGGGREGRPEEGLHIWFPFLSSEVKIEMIKDGGWRATSSLKGSLAAALAKPHLPPLHQQYASPCPTLSSTHGPLPQRLRTSFPGVLRPRLGSRESVAHIGMQPPPLPSRERYIFNFAEPQAGE